MSVSRLNDTHVKEGEVIFVKSEVNKGKAMLKPFRISGDIIRNIGRSEAERIANMIGRSYTAQRVEGVQVVKYAPEHLFVNPTKAEITAEKLSEANAAKLWKNTVGTNKLFKFLTLTAE